MMDYIVSPSFVYFLSILNNLSVFVSVFAIILGVAVFIISVVAFAFWHEGMDYGEDDPDYKQFLVLKKFLKILIPCLVVTILISVFRPDKNTLIEMKVASILTKENVNLTVETIKETVDYVVEAISKIK